MTGANPYSAEASTVTLQAVAKKPKVCRCGHDLNHIRVLPEPAYTHWGWLLFLIGVTAKPTAVLYRCLRCKQVLGLTREPRVLSRFD